MCPLETMSLVQICRQAHSLFSKLRRRHLAHQHELDWLESASGLQIRVLQAGHVGEQKGPDFCCITQAPVSSSGSQSRQLPAVGSEQSKACKACGSEQAKAYKEKQRSPCKGWEGKAGQDSKGRLISAGLKLL